MKRPSMRKAIDQFCRECNYDPLDHGTWRAQIESCQMSACPLYGFRPLTEDSTKKRAKQRKEGEL